MLLISLKGPCKLERVARLAPVHQVTRLCKPRSHLQAAAGEEPGRQGVGDELCAIAWVFQLICICCCC